MFFWLKDDTDLDTKSFSYFYIQIILVTDMLHNFQHKKIVKCSFCNAVKYLKDSDTLKIAVVIPEFEQCDFTVG